MDYKTDNELLESWYNENINLNLEIPFSELDTSYKKRLTDTIGFSMYRLNYRLEIVINEVKKSLSKFLN